MTTTDVLVGLAILVGLVGIVVPVLPGSLLIVAAAAVWALVVDQPIGWTVLAVVVVLLAVGQVVKLLVPGRRLQSAGVPSSTLWVGAATGLVGFFVVPVVGLFLGFVLGVYAAELRRVGSQEAWPSSVSALKAVGLSLLIELVAALLAASAWVVGVVLT